MKGSKTISPSSHYCLDLPAEIHEQYEGGVASFWHDKTDVVLQTSSYFRTEGDQVGAQRRLQERLHNELFTSLRPVEVTPARCSDAAAATGLDEEGLQWILGYAVWPDLAVFYSICGKQETFASKSPWACEAVRSMRRG